VTAHLDRTALVHPAGARSVRGLRPVLRLAAELDELAAATGTPLTASGAWLRTCLDGGATPWAVTVHEPDGRLAAALVLLDVVREPLTMLAATVDGHCVAVTSRNGAATTALAEVLRDQVRRRQDAGRRVALGPLVADENAWQLADALTGLLTARLCPPVPVVTRDARTAATAYLSDNMRRTLRKATNRLLSDGRSTTTVFSADLDEILPVVPFMLQAHRERDHEGGRRSPLDDAAGEAAWRRRLTLLLGAGLLETALLRIDGEPAAYVLALPDVPSYRILEGRFATRFARYSPGRLLEAAGLQRTLDDPRFTELDWMTPVGSETLLVFNDEREAIMLSADQGGPAGPSVVPRPRDEGPYDAAAPSLG